MLANNACTPRRGLAAGYDLSLRRRNPTHTRPTAPHIPHPIGLPHLVQKRTPAALRVPQRPQLRPGTPVSSELPQEVQKRSMARLGW